MLILQNMAQRFKPLTDEQKIAMGYSLVLADISFYYPHKPWLICPNSYTQQFYDLVPEFPQLNELLTGIVANGIKLERVRVTHEKGIARVEAIDGHFQVH